MKRWVEFCAAFDVTVKLAYYPPYHSKYNPIERVFGVLENFWNGDPLRTTDKALGLAEGMTYKGIHPTATLVTKMYAKGVKLSLPLRRLYEKALDRLSGLEKWSITITPEKAKTVCSFSQIRDD